MDIVKQGTPGQDATLYIPGWGQDRHVFSLGGPLKDGYYLNAYNPFHALSELTQFFETTGHRSWTLVGFSMGGFLALSLLDKQPQRFHQVLLMGVRQRYGDLSEIRQWVEKGHEGFYRSFTKQAVGANPKARAWLKSMYTQFRVPTQQELLLGLDYLEQVEIQADQLESSAHIRFRHGEHDPIAALEEVQALCEQSGCSLEILKGYAHLIPC